MSEIATLCHICGKGSVAVCKLCGRHVCKEHYTLSTGLCTSCGGGRKQGYK